MNRLAGCTLLAALAAAGAARGEPVTLIEWTFDRPDDLLGWQPNGQIADVMVAGGVVSGRTTDWDPFFTSPLFEIPARPWQVIEIRLKSDKPFTGEVFWTNTTEGQHGGFSQNKSTRFQAKGGDWETITVRPYWQAEGKIIHLRLDLADGCVFSLDSLRIVDLGGETTPSTASEWSFAGGIGDWIPDGLAATADAGGLSAVVERADGSLKSPPLAVPVADRVWLVVRMSSDKGTRGSVRWATAEHNGLNGQHFPLRSDGRMHTYNIDVGGQASWDGTLLALEISPAHEPGAKVLIESIALADEPRGGPDLTLVQFGLENAVNRVGKPAPLMLRLLNTGAETATGVSAELAVPPGVTARPAEGQPAPSFEFQIPDTFRWSLESDRAMSAQVSVKLSGPGAPPEPFTTTVTFTEPPPGVTATGYVPEPRPAKTDYDIGSYYFPRWYRAIDWECIDRIAPIRKPVLGWYDERLPEIVDWQIKWAVEHGVTFFLVDWYWSAGSRSLEHWLNEGYLNARYRSYLKWCVMWANHNAPNTHSEEDWVKVTQYWIDRFFGLPEYYRIDGKPAVFIWAPFNISRDVGGDEAAAKLLARSQEMARAAGYPGIVFAAMNAGGSEGEAKRLAAMGYTVHTSYHWWADAPSLAPDRMNFPFSLVVDRSRQAWDAREQVVEKHGLTFLPVADTGWDSRPWHGDRAMVIHDRTVPEFERLLREAKSWLDERGEKTLVLGPWNEWGEGSYIEPCAEFGWEMLRAIRRVFCDAPDERTDIAPIDVGLGPYDLPLAPTRPATEWTFDTPGDSLGWGPMMGLSDAVVADGALQARSTSPDPAFTSPQLNIRAAKYPYLALRMRVSPTATGKDMMQCFFTTPTSSTSEASSVKGEVIADGQYHTYVLKMNDNPRWRGMISNLRFDPVTTKDLEIAIDWIQLTDQPPGE